MAFNNYLEDENDKPYFTTNSLAYYYDKMEGFAKAVEGSAKALNLTKEEIEQRIALRLAEWDKNLESFDGSVEKLLSEWVDDGTLTHVIDTTLIDQKISPVLTKLAETVKKGEVSVSDIDRNKGKFDQTYMTDSFLQQIAGNTPINATVSALGLNTVKFDFKSVTKDKTDFFTFSTNLYNHLNSLADKSINLSGTMVDEANYTSTEFIPVSPNTNYVCNRFNRVAYYDENKVFVGFKDFSDVTIGNTFATPANGYFIRFRGFTTSINNNAQVNRGTSLLTYEPYRVELDPTLLPDVDGSKVKENTVGISAMNFIKRSSNLFNLASALRGFALNSQTGLPQENTAYTSTDFIEANYGDFHIAKGFNRVMYYGINKERLGFDDIVDGQVIEPRALTRYIRFHAMSQNVDTAQVNKGDVLLPYEPYYVTIDSLMIPDNQTKEKTYYFPPENIYGDYLATDEIRNERTLEELYSDYDSLIIGNPTYFTKTILGKDATNTYDVYEYRLKPVQIEANIAQSLPKMVFLHNIHGHEKSATFAMYHLVKEMCENWMNDPILEYLRFNVEFVFIPVLNPWGFVNNTYKNGRGVNIQTNFPVSFDSTGERGNPDSPIYAGTEPLSEAETQYAKQMIDANKDALHLVSFHTQDFPDINTSPLFYSQINSGAFYNREIEYIAKFASEKMIRLLVKEYGISNGTGKVVRRVGRGTEDLYSASLGIPTVINEHFYRLPDETEFYSSRCLKANTEYLGNWIITVLKRFKDIY